VCFGGGRVSDGEVHEEGEAQGRTRARGIHHHQRHHLLHGGSNPRQNPSASEITPSA